MENKIDIAAILKDCPRGMELDCAIYDGVTLDSVIFESEYFYENTNTYPIKIVTESGFSTKLTKYGQNVDINEAKCIIFPKGKTTWEGFKPPYKFKNDDIIIKRNFIAIISFIEPNGRIWYYCWYNIESKDCKIETDFGIGCINDGDEIRLATEEEKQKLFQVIESKGYKWDAKTKILEKLIIPKFKIGDRIRHSIIKTDNIYQIIGIKDSQYQLIKNKEVHDYYVSFTTQDDWELVSNKFDFTTLKPYDKILVRLTNDCIWMPKFFLYYDPKVKCYPFVTIDNIGYPQCIPYDGNEHLCRTANPCSDYYQI